MRTRLKALLTCMCLFGVHQAFAARPNVIYGADDRADYYEEPDVSVRAAADATVALIRAASLDPVGGGVTQIVTVNYGAKLGLCPSEPYFNQETAAYCSGFLVAPDLVVTAGHCVRTQQACDDTRFVFGFRVEAPGHTPRSVPTSQVFACRQLIHSVANADGEDFAVVRLDRAVTHTHPLSYRNSGKISLGEALTVMGHPSGLPLKIAGNGRVRDVQPEFLTASLDTYGGNSGSAVFNSVTGKVEGILVRGERDFQYVDGCRVSNICPETGCRGEDVTLFERVLPFLN